jgi:hypothetical protein
LQQGPAYLSSRQPCQAVLLSFPAEIILILILILYLIYLILIYMDICCPRAMQDKPSGGN